MSPPRYGANYTDVKTNNISAILTAILKHGTASRAQLVNEIGVSSATMTNLVGELTGQGILSEEGIIKGNIGRPQRTVQLVPDARFALGIHIDVDTVHISLTNALSQEIDHYTLENMDSTPWEEVLQASTNAAQTLISTHHIPPTKLVGVGMAATGLVDPFTGVNITAPNLSWHDAPLKTTIEKQLDMPAIVDNNVRAMALYEAMFGTAKHAHTLAFVYARIGVGAGLMINGFPYRGAGAGAGEIGHTTVVMDGGATCRCGNVGCLETVFSAPALLKHAQQIAQTHPNSQLARQTHPLTLDHIFTAARAGDPATQAMLTDRARYVGITLANLVNVFNPEMIMLGGIFTQERGTIFPTIQQIIQNHSFSNLGHQVQLQISQYGQGIGRVGAAALALDTFFYRPMNRYLPHKI